MKRKMLCIMLAGFMAVSLTGCGGSSGNTDSAGSSAGEQNAADDNQAAASGEQITLTLWDIWPEGQPLCEIIDGYIADYEEENQNIKINRVSTQEVDYQNTKLKVAAADGSQGDIFSCWGGGYAKTYVDAGVVLPLDEYYEKYGINDELLEGATTYIEYNDQVYGLPLKQWAGVLFCNKRIFDENNLEIPATYDELLNCVKTFRANGITPMVLGAKDAWHIGMIQNALAVRTAGADYMNQALSGEATLDTPEIVESAELLCELNEAGAFPEGTLGISSDEASEEFYSGMVPMFYGGSWEAQSIDLESNAVSKDEVVVAPMPTVDGGKGDATEYSGGVIDFLCINAKTEHPDEAFDFAYGLTKYLSQKAYEIGDSLPCWKDINVEDADISPTLVKVVDQIQDSTAYVLAWDTILQGSAIDAHYNLLQGLIDGSLTPEDFAVQMQEAQEESRAE